MIVDVTVDEALARALADGPDPEQIAAFRKLSPEERLMTAQRLYRLARDVKAAGLRSAHPGWSDDEVEREVCQAFLLART